MRKIDNVLKNWELIEYLSAGILPKKTILKPTQVLQPLTEERKQLGSEIGKLTGDKKTIVYLNCFKKSELQAFFNYYFKTDMTTYDHEEDEEQYSASIEIDANLQYIEGSLFIPHMMILINKLNNTPLGQELVFEEIVRDNHQKCYKFIEQEIKNYFSENEVAISDVIHSIELLMSDYFKLDNLNLASPTVSYTLIGITEEDKPLNLDSVSLYDIQKIRAEGASPALSKFIIGTEQRDDIDENRELIMSLVHPDELPLGRWPSNNSEKLTLMQQVSVNLAASMKDAVFSINSPLGTDNQTVLKDIFADLIVQRAFKMIGLTKPTDGFTEQKESTLSDETRHPKQLMGNLVGYGVTLASSNPQAVAAITKSIAKRLEPCAEIGSLNEQPSYKKLLNESAYFHNYSELINETEPDTYWGLVTVDFNSSADIDNFLTLLLEGSKTQGLPNFKETLSEVINTKSKNNKTWEQVKEEFLDTIIQIENEQSKIIKYKKAVLALEQSQAAYLRAVKHYEEKSKLVDQASQDFKAALTAHEQAKEIVDNLPLDSMVQKIKYRLVGKEKADTLKARKNLYYATQELSRSKESLTAAKVALDEAIKDQEATEASISELEVAIKEGKAYFDSDNNLTVGDEVYWAKENYAERQKNVPWISDKLNYYRGSLFIKALQVHKFFIVANQEQIQNALHTLSKRQKYDINKRSNQELLSNCWHIFQLVVPVIGTTFANIDTLYHGLGKGSIENLIIINADQVKPQHAIGAIQRALNIISIGDTTQTLPVSAAEKVVLCELAKSFNLDANYLANCSSVQNLADYANPYGTYREDGSYMGTPLWVCHDCNEPMFSISNELTYEQKLISSDKNRHKMTKEAYWINVTGKTTSHHFISEEAKVLVEHLSTERTLKDVFVVSALPTVSNHLKKILGSGQYLLPHIPIETLNDWKKNNIGINQLALRNGAKIVYFICGMPTQKEVYSDEITYSIKIAVTQTQDKLVIIGNHQYFSEIPSCTILKKYTEVRSSSYNN